MHVLKCFSHVLLYDVIYSEITIYWPTGFTFTILNIEIIIAKPLQCYATFGHYYVTLDITCICSEWLCSFVNACCYLITYNYVSLKALIHVLIKLGSWIAEASSFNLSYYMTFCAFWKMKK